MTSVSARKDLYEMKFNPKKEKAAEFWDNFEEKIRMYENVPDAGKMPEKEKRDIFINAVIESVPGIEVFNCLNRQTTGQDVSYSGLKDYLLQVESTTRREAPKTAMFSRRGYRSESGRGRGEMREANRGDSASGDIRCYSCGRYCHLARNCPTPGQRVCYVCHKPGHEAKDCKAERVRESTETRCLKNGRKELTLQASTDRGAPRAPQLEVGLAPEAQATEVVVAEAEVAVPHTTGP